MEEIERFARFGSRSKQTSRGRDGCYKGQGGREPRSKGRRCERLRTAGTRSCQASSFLAWGDGLVPSLHACQLAARPPFTSPILQGVLSGRTRRSFFIVGEEGVRATTTKTTWWDRCSPVPAATGRSCQAVLPRFNSWQQKMGERWAEQCGPEIMR